MQTSWFLSTMPGVISCTLIFLSTLLFALFIGGILRMRSQPHLVPQSRRTRYAKTPVWYMLWKEKLHLIVLIWAAQIVTSVRWHIIYSWHS
ncbi:hypothetical protein BC629DRAFT_445020 [Irpex lacteus]|nr:hypothetical protein BC629DRAFT_445020 [Irpex lacteus]